MRRAYVIVSLLILDVLVLFLLKVFCMNVEDNFNGDVGAWCSATQIPLLEKCISFVLLLWYVTHTMLAIWLFLRIRRWTINNSIFF